MRWVILSKRVFALVGRGMPALKSLDASPDEWISVAAPSREPGGRANPSGLTDYHRRWPHSEAELREDVTRAH